MPLSDQPMTGEFDGTEYIGIVVFPLSGKILEAIDISCHTERLMGRNIHTGEVECVNEDVTRRKLMGYMSLERYPVEQWDRFLTLRNQVDVDETKYLREFAPTQLQEQYS